MNKLRQRARTNRIHPKARQFLDAILESTNGLATPVYAQSDGESTRGAALSFRQQCFDLRSRDRTRSLRLPPEDPGHGATPYDDINLDVVEKDGTFYVVGHVYPLIPLTTVPADEVEDGEIVS